MPLERVTKDYMHNWWGYLTGQALKYRAASASEFLVSLSNLCSCDDWHADDDD